MRRLAMVVGTLALAVSRADSQAARFLPVNGASLYVESVGEGPAIVLVHGWGHSLETWNYLTPAVSGSYRVVRYDRRGYGRSTDSPDPTQDPVDLRDLLDSLGIRSAIVAGHSAGAAAALRFALAFPERLGGLILYGAPAPSGFGLRWNGRDALPANYLTVARERGLDAMWQLFEGHPLLDGYVKGTPGDSLNATMLKSYDGREIFHAKPASNATPAATIARIGEIRVPTLVITGEREMPFFQVVAEALAYGIPGAKRVVVLGGGHGVHLQQPSSFNAAIMSFLRSVPR